MSDPGWIYLVTASLPLLASLVLLVLRQRAKYLAGWIAVGALTVSAILSLVGLLLYQHHVQFAKDQLQQVQPWSGSFIWMKLSHLLYENSGRLGFAADAPGIELRLGYQVDSLTTFLFMLITLVALAIHLVAVRSMWKEHKPDLYDALAHTHRPGRYPQFFMLLSFFTGVMLHLVLAANLLQLFVCWELVGLASYFLIGFYREQPLALKASRKAFLMNRVGDVGFLVGIVILFTFTGTLSLITVKEDVYNVLGNVVMEDGLPKKRIDQLNIADALRVPARDSHDEPFAEKGAEAGQICRVNEARNSRGKLRLELAEQGTQVVVWNQETLNGHYDKPLRGRLDAFNAKLIGGHGQGFRTMPYWLLGLAGLGLFLGCIGKSAQIPLQTWLPDAMAGPTPVSALVHSATMVAAGVYLLARIYPVLVPEVLLIIAYVGVVTAFYGASCAMVQTDVKRLLAFSTMSQLGLMLAGIGVGGWAMGLFHLATHACCKALLFLGTGAVVDCCQSVQDISRLGGLRRRMPWLAWLMLFACLSLVGLPLLPGWYSKDGILEALISFSSLNQTHLTLAIAPLITSALTAAYLTRFYWLLFMGESRDGAVTSNAVDIAGLLRWPLVALALLALVLVWLPHPLAMEKSNTVRLINQSEPAAVLDSTAGTWATSAGQLAGHYFNKESWLRPLGEQFHLTPFTLTACLTFALSLLGGLITVRRYHRKPAVPWGRPAGTLQYFLFDGWHWDRLLSRCFVQPCLLLGRFLQMLDRWLWDGLVHGFGRLARLLAFAERRLDEQLIDGLVQQTARITQASGLALRQVQTGTLRFYVALLLLVVVAVSGVIMAMTFFNIRY